MTKKPVPHLVPGAVYYIEHSSGERDWITVLAKHIPEGSNRVRYSIESVLYGRQQHDESSDTTSRFLERARRWDPENDCLWSLTHGAGPVAELDESEEKAA